MATYGLAVDYKYLDFHALEVTSAAQSSLMSPLYSCSCTNIISVCGKCQRSNDYGNFMLGVVIASAGEDMSVADLAGQIFNLAAPNCGGGSLNDQPHAAQNKAAVIAGYNFVRNNSGISALNRSSFCTSLASLGTGWFDPRNSSCTSGRACVSPGPNLDYASNSKPDWNQYVSKTVVGGNNPEGYNKPLDELIALATRRHRCVPEPSSC